MPKLEACDWILANMPKETTILDVGAVSGWELPEYKVDAIETWEPTAIACAPYYRKVFHKDASFDFGYYDLIVINDGTDPGVFRGRCGEIYGAKKRGRRKK